MGYGLWATIQSVWFRLIGLLLPSTMRRHLTVGMLETKVRNGTGTDSDYEMLDELRTKVDVSLLTTQEMLEEIVARYDVAVFVGTRDLTDDSHGITYARCGDPLRRMGLNTWVRMSTFQEFES